MTETSVVAITEGYMLISWGGGNTFLEFRESQTMGTGAATSHLPRGNDFQGSARVYISR